MVIFIGQNKFSTIKSYKKKKKNLEKGIKKKRKKNVPRAISPLHFEESRTYDLYDWST